MSTYQIQTFGCQMNYSDSERVAAVLELCGFESTDNKGVDLLVVNTCSVRQKSEDKAYGFMVQYKKDHPEVIIAVTGCMVRQTGNKSNSQDKLLQYDPIGLVFRIEDTARLPKLLEDHFPALDLTNFVSNFGQGSVENYFQINPRVANKSQALVPIMQGCDKFCSYCIVPFTRGREISRPSEDIIKECKKHVNNGALEITLLGQNVNSYTEDGKKCFPKLLKEIDKLKELGLSRLRFVSHHPQDFTDEMIDTLSSMKTNCPYVHLPVQHGSNRVLKKMNRNYTIEEYEKKIEQIRKKIPGCAIATDIIVGFPGERDEDFQELCDFAKRMKFDFSYTAIFSPRRGTRAAEMKDEFVPLDIKKKRFHVFDEIIKETSFDNREKSIGKILEVLVETSKKLPNRKFRNSGRTREYFETWFDSKKDLLGKEVKVKVTGRNGYVLEGGKIE
ncbi:tRNA (N6-isopentenyl adenosine(37)-C2)-methylthiotransferase MiaB [Candidatus Gracilibacteria bacterium]|nr:tRNA (N6-isopentenyl adenosine(37)-C2)-methylthiotransferase MiaB [Candidatus Gracilibacteria bacterium]